MHVFRVLLFRAFDTKEQFSFGQNAPYFEWSKSLLGCICTLCPLSSWIFCCYFIFQVWILLVLIKSDQGRIQRGEGCMGWSPCLSKWHPRGHQSTSVFKNMQALKAPANPFKPLSCRPQNARCRPLKASFRPKKVSCRPLRSTRRSPKAWCRPMKKMLPPSGIIVPPLEGIMAPSEVMVPPSEGVMPCLTTGGP